MKKEKAKALINQALNRAIDHLAGARDKSLPTYLDSQVARFLDKLKEMEASLNSQPFKAQPSKVMTTAIADGWPFESELGKLICVAESAYGSLESNP
jgi:hypothetical protein